MASPTESRAPATRTSVRPQAKGAPGSATPNASRATSRTSTVIPRVVTRFCTIRAVSSRALPTGVVASRLRISRSRYVPTTVGSPATLVNAIDRTMITGV